MKAAFRLDANNEIGAGHAFRCLALIEEFQERECECAIFSRDNSLIRGFAVEHGLELVPVPDGVNSAAEAAWLDREADGFDIIVLDLFNFKYPDYLDSLNRPGRVLVCVDENALMPYSCDIVINGYLNAPEFEYSFGRKNPKMLLGGQYSLLRREFREAAPLEVRDKAIRVLICFGGSDARGFSPKAVSALRDIPGIELYVALGTMTACDDEVRALAGEGVRVFKTPESFPALIRDCDIAVIGGGAMVYEMASIGIPSVIVTQADNQENLARYMDKNALMTYAGSYADITPYRLRELCGRLLQDAPRRRRESAALRGAVARDGAAKAAEVITGMVNQD